MTAQSSGPEPTARWHKPDIYSASAQDRGWAVKVLRDGAGVWLGVGFLYGNRQTVLKVRSTP